MQQHALTPERALSVANRFTSGVRVWLSNDVRLLHYVSENPIIMNMTGRMDGARQNMLGETKHVSRTGGRHEQRRD